MELKSHTKVNMGTKKERVLIQCMYRQSPVNSPDIKNIIVITLTFLSDLLKHS